MPVPGPRTQTRPLPGYNNPEGELPDKFNLWDRPGSVAQVGRSPGTMAASLRGNILAPGTIRRLWRQSVDYIAASAPYSWTDSSPMPERPASVPARGLGITTALRYMTRSVYVNTGTDNTRYGGLHTKIAMRSRSKPVTTGSGQTRSRPTVRNRMTSFGSRVPPLNPKVPGADKNGE